MKRALIFLFFAWMAWPLKAQNDDSKNNSDTLSTRLVWPRHVQRAIDQQIQAPLLDVSQLGMLVWDLTADSAIYRYNERQLMRPASTMKLVTAITALDCLGGNYLYSTSLLYRGNIVNRRLIGDLYVIGGMDPMLDGSDIDAFVKALRNAGIDSICGTLLADKSMKDTLRWGEGWCWDDKNPPLSPLTLGRNVHFMERFAAQLAAEGMVSDSVVLGDDITPDDAEFIAVKQHSLDHVLLKMMKESDNFYAESVLFQTATSHGNRFATARDGLAQTRRLVNSIGLNASDYRFADGSGLSLYNYVSAELLTRLLRYAWLKKDIYVHLLPSLPIAGQDGTLKKRMRRSAAEGNVRAKTGTLTGIVSLAGYCTAANGHELCFAIINQGIMHSREGRDFQDRICELLCKP